MEEYDLNKDKWWMELGLEFAKIRTAYDPIREFIGIKFGYSHSLFKLIAKIEMGDLWCELDSCVCGDYPLDTTVLPSYPHIKILNVFSTKEELHHQLKYTIMKRNRRSPKKNIVIYEKYTLIEFITDLFNYVDKLVSYPVLSRRPRLIQRCELLRQIMSEFIAKLNNVVVECNRNEIMTKEQLEKYPIGSLISYMNVNGRFKLGGFIVKFCEDYFIYVAPDFVTKYRARYSHVRNMWVGDVYRTPNDIVSIVPWEGNVSKYSVTVNDVVVYYGCKKYKTDMYRTSRSFKNIMKWCEYFS